MNQPTATISPLDGIATILDALVLVGGIVVSCWWLTGEGLFYTTTGPVMSPFTAISLVMMSGTRLAQRYLEVWPLTLTLAWLGIVIGGNLSSLLAQVLVPDLFVYAMPDIVPTSIMTSVGIIVFCSYELLVTLRPTPRSALIVDDVLLQLALFPGGLSLLGHWLDKPVYISAAVDPRTGISLLEMAFMGAFASAAALANHHLYLWRFLADNNINKVVFAIFFGNQFLAPLLVAKAFGSAEDKVGVELFVMLAGTFATLAFLGLRAYLEIQRSDSIKNEMSPAENSPST